MGGKAGSAARGPEDDRKARTGNGGQRTGKPANNAIGHEQDLTGPTKRRRRHVSSRHRRTQQKLCREEYDPDAMLLEPWAVQAALGRRRGGKALTMEDIGDI